MRELNMSMYDVLQTLPYITLIIHIFMVAVAVWRVWRGENVIDRLIAVDLSSTLFLAVTVIIAIISGDSIYIDVALVLAAMGFISTVALSKYIATEKMF
jgi:multicomponent K+:H+ antiporter subunit F